MSVSDLPALARPSIRLRLGGSLRDVLSTRGGSRLLTAVTIAGFAVPAAIYLWLIQRFSVNVVFVDQWSDVSLIGRSYHGTLTFGSLWAQHNENRLLFPNLLSLLIARTSSFDVVVEEYVGAVFLFAAVALLVLAHRRRSPELPWIAYCPVAILSLSVAQAGNTLWGFQLAWYLVMLMLAVTLFLLDAPEVPDLKPVPHTAFQARVRTARSLDLTREPLVGERSRWTDPSDYGPTQALAGSARQAGLQALRYESVRDPRHEACVAVLDPKVFGRSAPQGLQTWFIAAGRRRVRCLPERGEAPAWDFEAVQLLAAVHT